MNPEKTPSNEIAGGNLGALVDIFETISQSDSTDKYDTKSLEVISEVIGKHYDRSARIITNPDGYTEELKGERDRLLSEAESDEEREKINSTFSHLSWDL